MAHITTEQHYMHVQCISGDVISRRRLTADPKLHTILLRTWIFDQNPWTDADSKVLDPHIDATNLGVATRKIKMSSGPPQKKLKQTILSFGNNGKPAKNAGRLTLLT